MVPRLLRLHPSTYQRLARLTKEAERDGAYRVAKRLRAVVLNSEGHTSGELAEILQAPRSKVSKWLQRYQADGIDGLLEGYRSGRPSELSEKQQRQLGERKKQVGDPHQHLIQGPPTIAGQRADEDPQGDRDEDRRQADGNGDPPPVEQAGQEVPPQVIGPQRMRERRPCEFDREIDLIDRLRVQEGADQGPEGEGQEHQAARHRQAMPLVPPPGVAPQRPWGSGSRHPGG